MLKTKFIQIKSSSVFSKLIEFYFLGQLMNRYHNESIVKDFPALNLLLFSLRSLWQFCNFLLKFLFLEIHKSIFYPSRYFGYFSSMFIRASRAFQNFMKRSILSFSREANARQRITLFSAPRSFEPKAVMDSFVVFIADSMCALVTS
jgi:hypothetical protein